MIYGVEGYKVHSKVCLVTRRDRGVIHYITQIGTGNYNEKTAKQYTDVCLMTANPQIGEDATAFFKNMAIGNLEGQYRQLWVAPRDLKHQILQAIDAEIAKGKQGRVLLKLNSVTDIDLIEKLKQASCAGVQITMIVRGICCILPGVPAVSYTHLDVYKRQGFACSRSPNEDVYLVQKMVRTCFGTNNTDNCARVCHSASVAGLAKTLGSGAMTNPIGDITKDVDCILLVGSNPEEALSLIHISWKTDFKSVR